MGNEFSSSRGPKALWQDRQQRLQPARVYKAPLRSALAFCPRYCLLSRHSFGHPAAKKIVGAVVRGLVLVGQGFCVRKVRRSPYLKFYSMKKQESNGGNAIEKRVLRISETTQQRTFSNNVHVPFIRISGQWLKKNGFDIGDQIEVEASRKKLVITLVPKKRGMK